MRGMSHIDPMETATVRHAEGNEGEKIGVKRGFGAFYGAKLLKRKEGDASSERETGAQGVIYKLQRQRNNRGSLDSLQS